MDTKCGYRDVKKRLYIIGALPEKDTIKCEALYVGTTADTFEWRKSKHENENGALLFKTHYLNFPFLCEECKALVPSKFRYEVSEGFLYKTTGKTELDEDLVTCALYVALGGKHVFGGRLAHVIYKEKWAKELGLEELREEYFAKMQEQLFIESPADKNEKMHGLLYFLYISSNKDQTIWMLTQKSDTDEAVQNVFQDGKISNCIVFTGNTNRVNISAKVALLKYYLEGTSVCGGKYWYPGCPVSNEVQKIVQGYHSRIRERLLSKPFCYYCKGLTDHFASEHSKAMRFSNKKSISEEEEAKKVEDIDDLTNHINNMGLGEDNQTSMLVVRFN
eukprot:TRINITY_DN136827_c0_g1_i1.p1 TRINITY_DN136827_c0_g1~~TRINITY_DN136827_c0_g1_i1.p1  ORF type:complete len:362 (+),score=31.30 TRINITY_DN136827_c0_g1_i1:89-1087(+)